MDDFKIKRVDLEEIAFLIQNGLIRKEVINYIKKVVEFHKNKERKYFIDDAFEYYENYLRIYLIDNFDSIKNMFENPQESSSLRMGLIISSSILENENKKVENNNYKIYSLEQYLEKIQKYYNESKLKQPDIIIESSFKTLLQIFKKNTDHFYSFFFSSHLNEELKKHFYEYLVKLSEEDKIEFKQVLECLCRFDEMKGFPGVFSIKNINMKYPLVKLDVKTIDVNSKSTTYCYMFFIFTTLYEILTKIVHKLNINYYLYNLFLNIRDGKIELDYQNYNMNLYEIADNYVNSRGESNYEYGEFTLVLKERSKEGQSIEKEILKAENKEIKKIVNNFQTKEQFKNSIIQENTHNCLKYAFQIYRNSYFLEKHSLPTDLLRYKLFPKSKYFIGIDSNYNPKYANYIDWVELIVPKINMEVDNVYFKNDKNKSKDSFLNNDMKKERDMKKKLKFLGDTKNIADGFTKEQVNEFNFNNFNFKENDIIFIKTKLFSAAFMNKYKNYENKQIFQRLSNGTKVVTEYTQSELGTFINDMKKFKPNITVIRKKQ